MDLEELRKKLIAGAVHLVTTIHARTEAVKDGLEALDLEGTVHMGTIVEEYHDRDRVLLLAFSQGDVVELPCHVVLEYVDGELPRT